MTTTQLDIKQIGEAVEAASDPFRRLLEQIHRVIVGQDDLVHKMLIGLLSNGHVLIEGVPGLSHPLHTIIKFHGDDRMSMAHFSPVWRLRLVSFEPTQTLELTRN